MEQGCHTFLILCVTGAIHLHSAWGLPSDGFYSWVQKVWMSQLFYTFPILCVTGAMNLHSALGRPSEFLGFPEIRKCGNLEIKEFLCKNIKTMKNIKNIESIKKLRHSSKSIKSIPWKASMLTEFQDFLEIRNSVIFVKFGQHRSFPGYWFYIFWWMSQLFYIFNTFFIFFILFIFLHKDSLISRFPHFRISGNPRNSDGWPKAECNSIAPVTQNIGKV